MTQKVKQAVNQANEYLIQTHQESLLIRNHFIENSKDTLVRAALCLAQTINVGGKVLIFGNGGSAADAQHMAAEMVGRMLVKRRPLPAIALTTDSSALTAISNDFSYEEVFEKQVEALAQKGDCLIAISTSGNSKNVLQACEKGKSIGCSIIGVTGGSGGHLKNVCDYFLSAEKGTNSSRIQETHIFILHSLVDLMDRFFLEVK